MINFKQKELIKKIWDEIQKKFPEVRLINVTPSPENPDILWVNITAPEDEDREIELSEYASEKETDVLLEYGYRLMFMPTRNPEHANFWGCRRNPLFIKISHHELITLNLQISQIVILRRHPWPSIEFSLEEV